MSTRCQIGFYAQGNDNLLKPDALLYRHSDGYPGTVRAFGKKEFLWSQESQTNQGTS